MYTNPWKATEKIEFDDTTVGVLALITMYQVMTFLILQILVNFPILIIILLPELDLLDKNTAESLSLVTMVIIELTLIYILIKKGKRNFRQHLELVRDAEAKIELNNSAPSPYAFGEIHLEAAIGLTALAGLGWGVTIGMGSFALQIVLMIVESFAFIFLITFMIVRFITTRKIRLTALGCLILSGAFLWVVYLGIR